MVSSNTKMRSLLFLSILAVALSKPRGHIGGFNPGNGGLGNGGCNPGNGGIGNGGFNPGNGGFNPGDGGIFGNGGFNPGNSENGGFNPGKIINHFADEGFPLLAASGSGMSRQHR